MRLRTLSEAECYTRLYGARSDERVTFVRVLPSRDSTVGRGERLRELFEQRLDERGPEAEAA
jgi:hypothetical protein